MTKSRCSWPKDDPIYLEYHDKEWGVPVYDDLELFEKLILDGSQAGLSWITILKRQANYRKAYDQFDPFKMANWTEVKIETLLEDSGIIRNRLKILAARQNAKSYLKLIEEKGSFSDFLWSFVNHNPITNYWESWDKTPAKTKESEKMSKELKSRGFQFVGPTICYAFMQAVGMVNDHITSCFRHSEIAKQY
ncbi:DNA-3-methyladenine glycosylase I [Candidatus Seribacter sulfatis]|jgi:DNA-3-methyladenine glycosylase I|uniref:DNA-3-methyladenine glycosylase I n=1 Tax=Candidatus Seribacter sulfatis TaxID=3381756 RepID=UPI003899C7FD